MMMALIKLHGKKKWGSIAAGLLSCGRTGKQVIVAFHTTHAMSTSALTHNTHTHMHIQNLILIHKHF
jgi:hypothetical protein